MMTLDHTADLPGGPALAGPGNGFGLGFRIVTNLVATQTLGSVGMYGWSGIYGTNFWIDPREKLFAILMVQRYPGSTAAGVFQPLVYQTLTQSNPVPVR
jgi:CubicO group peptidase (beta-lactamase class C family)